MGEKKLMYVLRGNGESHEAWARRMRDEVSPELLRLGPSKLQLTLTESPPPKLSLFPFKAQPIAIFNVYGDANAPSRFTNLLGNAASSISGYEVEEAYPVSYERAWDDGEPTPSPILLTMHDCRICPGTDRLCILPDRAARHLHPSRAWPDCKKLE